MSETKHHITSHHWSGTHHKHICIFGLSRSDQNTCFYFMLFYFIISIAGSLVNMHYINLNLLMSEWSNQNFCQLSRLFRFHTKISEFNQDKQHTGIYTIWICQHYVLWTHSKNTTCHVMSCHTQSPSTKSGQTNKWRKKWNKNIKI